MTSFCSLNYIPQQLREREETLVQAGGNLTLTVQGHHIYRGLLYRTTTQSSALFSLQLITWQCRLTALLCSLSMWLARTIDTVPAVPWVARLGRTRPAHHLGFISAPRAATHVSGEKNFCKAWCHRYSCNRSCTVSLVLWYFGSFIHLPLSSCCSPSLSLWFTGPSLCASARGQSAVSI